MKKLVLNGKGEFCYASNLPGRRWPINEREFLLEILAEKKCSYEEAIKIFDQLKQEAITQSEENHKNTDFAVIENTVRNSGIFNNFIVIQNTVFKTAAVYYDKGEEGRDFVCPLKNFDAKMIEDYYTLNLRDRLAEIGQMLKPIINPKRMISDEEMITYCSNILSPKVTIPRIETDEDPHPVSVEGCNKLSLIVIPFKQKNVTLDDLNPFLKEFLTRVSRHEHLCAVIWTNLIGIKSPYVVYMQGPGGDGKSAFNEMLVHLVKGSSASFDTERFNGYNMYNKALLVLHENNSINIMQNEVIKSVSGNDRAKIEGKGRDAFYGKIRGQIHIISNVQPKIQGEDNEYRRLCYYTVEKANITPEEILLPEVYFKELSSTPNEFLNYCRQCYESLKTKTGLVKAPEGYDDLLRALRDQETADTNRNLLLRLSEYFELDPEGKVETISIIRQVKDIEKNNKYAVHNFERFLLNDYGVKKDGLYYIGIRKK